LPPLSYAKALVGATDLKLKTERQARDISAYVLTVH
jgi:hypothetical protein